MKPIKPAQHQKLINEFLEQLDLCIFLPEKEAHYWKINIHKMPPAMLKHFYDYLKQENQTAAEDIAKTLDNDPEIVQKIESKRKKLLKKMEALYDSLE